ncbi:MAG: hypothetical protein HYS20_13710 [Rhodocyclales bacterium]|nr:hypothetical protein [Rhodocyclales bacterium]
MHLIRRLIALLLIVTLPVYAWAALGLPDACPMQVEAVAQAGEIGNDCCASVESDDDASSEPTERTPCKPGQQCKTGSIHPPYLPTTAQAHAAPATIVAFAESPLLSRSPAGIWRPPRSV